MTKDGTKQASVMISIDFPNHTGMSLDAGIARSVAAIDVSLRLNIPVSWVLPNFGMVQN